jgi:P-type Cu+ transporter
MRLVSVVALAGRDERALLALAASLARGSQHPLAAAILDGARERGVEPGHVEGRQEITGAGVTGAVAGHPVVLGHAALYADLGLAIGDLGDWGDRLRRQGQCVIYLAVDGRPAGLLGVDGMGREAFEKKAACQGGSR